jgi:hypothetical protein
LNLAETKRNTFLLINKAIFGVYHLQKNNAEKIR